MNPKVQKLSVIASPVASFHSILNDLLVFNQVEVTADPLLLPFMISPNAIHVKPFSYASVPLTVRFNILTL